MTGTIDQQQLAHTVQQIADRHKPEVLQLVAMHHLCTSLLDNYGRANRVSLDSQVTMLDKVTCFYVKTFGISMLEWHAAHRALISAGRVLNE